MAITDERLRFFLDMMHDFGDHDLHDVFCRPGNTEFGFYHIQYDHSSSDVIGIAVRPSERMLVRVDLNPRSFQRKRGWKIEDSASLIHEYYIECYRRETFIERFPEYIDVNITEEELKEKISFNRQPVQDFLSRLKMEIL